MSLTLPYPWSSQWAIVVTKLTPTLEGGTTVEATLDGEELRPFDLEHVVVGPEPGQSGLDDVRNEIESEIRDQVAAGLAVMR